MSAAPWLEAKSAPIGVFWRQSGAWLPLRPRPHAPADATPGRPASVYAGQRQHAATAGLVAAHAITSCITQAGATSDHHGTRSEEHTSELQSLGQLVCRHPL